jgi:hypothetical protein
MYVNQHDFFISQDRFLQKSDEVEGYQLDDQEPSSETGSDLWVDWLLDCVLNLKSSYHRWRSMNDPDKPAPDREPGLDALFDEIRVTVSQEAQIIQAVFPDKEEVMKVFLQRVFAQVVRTSSLSSSRPTRTLTLPHRFSNSWSISLKKLLRSVISRYYEYCA